VAARVIFSIIQNALAISILAALSFGLPETIISVDVSYNGFASGLEIHH